jgi:uncharacterized protein (TIGR03492 family)
LAWGDVALAMAGTATEQFVGLGKPALTVPGKGPQFTKLFAERQRDLLGESVILADEVSLGLRYLIGGGEELTRKFLSTIEENGRLRMGEAGAAKRIAAKLIEF